ncbi:hypothetical protein MFLAVUS_011129 [Mucor flavus]|uniref:Uncharacterized protein n=1 Tax=Mucor flavus TaxID=439312 RepID=A0ABP9ZEQ6_9FUNG
MSFKQHLNMSIHHGADPNDQIPEEHGFCSYILYHMNAELDLLKSLMYSCTAKLRVSLQLELKE